MMNVLINILSVFSRGVPGLVVAGVALILMIIALVRKEASLMVLAAIFTIPYTYMSGDWTGVRLFVRLIPLFPLLAAFAISKDETLLAWVAPFPAFGALVYFLYNLILSGLRSY
jgi:hypothetical protein